MIQRDLNKRRENKVKAELASKQDRVNQLRQEIAENERQLDMAQVGGIIFELEYFFYHFRRTLRKYPE